MKLFLIVLFILNTLHLTAQEKMICFSVLSNDLSASTECRLDDKGKACALIKIQAMDKIEKVEGDIIGELIVKGNEAWVYLKPGSTKIKIFFGKHSPIELVFADYGIKALESKVSYSLELLLVDYDYLDSLDVKIVTALADDSFDDQKYGIAASYYMNAANRGLPIAQFDLGYCYRYGYGVPQNYAKMIYWYKKSLDNGYANALCALGECYAIGLGVDIDDVLNVYHYAASGNLCDYVQEIGRAARKVGMNGIASTDFYYNDMAFMNRLFGMSQIREYQLKKVLEGIYDVYKSKRYEKRSMFRI